MAETRPRRSHFLPRTRDGWIATVSFLGLFVLAQPPLFGGPLELWRAVSEQRPDLLTLPGPSGFFTPGA